MITLPFKKISLDVVTDEIQREIGTSFTSLQRIAIDNIVFIACEDFANERKQELRDEIIEEMEEEMRDKLDRALEQQLKKLKAADTVK